MRLRTTLGLLVAVLVAGALIIFVERDTESTRARHTRLGRLFSDGLHDIDTVLFSAPAWRAECRRTDDDWDIVRPIEGRADAGVIERVLAAMESMTRTETITTRQRRLRELQLGDFGPGRSNWTVTAARAAVATTASGSRPVVEAVAEAVGVEVAGVADVRSQL